MPDSTIAQSYTEEVRIWGVLDQSFFRLVYRRWRYPPFAHQSKMQPPRLIFQFDDFARFDFAAATGHVVRNQAA
jgi:hypothetical protein